MEFMNFFFENYEILISGSIPYLNGRLFTGIVKICECRHISVTVHPHQIRLQVDVDVPAVGHLPQSVGEIFHTENNRQRRIVDELRAVPLAGSPQIVLGDVANFLRCAGAFDRRSGEREQNVALLELFQRFQVPVNVFG